MQVSEILEGIRHAQAVQDQEGADHPGQTFAYTFPVTYVQQLLLPPIEGLEFVEQAEEADGDRHIVGCFKPRAS